MDKLFAPGKIGRLTIKNRVVLAPMQMMYGEHLGYAGEKAIAYYEERARGGVGLIIVEGVNVDEVNNKPWNLQMSLAADKYTASFQPLTEAIHKYDCHCFVQLHHYGAKSAPTAAGKAWAASEVPVAPGGPSAHKMTVEEIKIVEQRFIDAAVRAQKAGFDGVELAGSHGYLLHQFLSPYYNNRTDEYGGSIENCLRIYTEIVQGIKARLGKDFPVSVRFCGDEFTPHIPKTRTVEDAAAIARVLEAAGADVLNVSNGNNFNANANCEPYSYDSFWKAHVTRAVKEAISIPLIATNTIKDPLVAEETLEKGLCDFVALGRALIADPFFMNKAAKGDVVGIRKCIGCMYCREQLYAQLPVKCALNPRVGYESIYPLVPEQDGAGRVVVVIGGGPAGMQSAVTLAKRGFDVTLFEKEDALGGTMNLADKGPHKEKITRFVETMKAEVERAGVKVLLGKAPSIDEVKALAPEGVVMAAGAAPIVPRIPGVDKPHVCTAYDVISGDVKVSGKVALIGSGITGLECAEMMLNEGCQVAMIEMLDAVGTGMFPIIVNDVMSRIKPKDPAMYLHTMLTEIGDGYVMVKDVKTGEEKRIEADHVVLSLGVAPRADVLAAYRSAFKNVICVGDNAQRGRIPHATKEGYIKSLVFLKD